MLLDSLNRFYADLSQFDENKPIIVVFDRKNYELSMHQLGKTIICGYLSNMFFNKHKIHIGILTQLGANKLRKNIMDLIAMQEIHDGLITTHINNLGISFYKLIRTNTYLYSGFLVHTLDLFFLCRVADDSKLLAMDDVADSFWMPLDQVRPEEFGLDSVRQGVARFLEEHKKK